MESLFAQAFGQDISKITAQEKQELLSRLLARLAHEIRNPLSSLHIHVQLLEEDVLRNLPELKSKVAGRFEIIHGELNRLETIVKQFVSLSGPAALNVESVELEKIVGGVCALLQPEAASRGVMLINQCVPGTPLRADPVQLTQAFVNLIINSIQAMERGGEVKLSAWKAESGKGAETGPERVIIQVRDTGPGVEPARQSAVFEPFYTTKQEGTGLGLWIVQQIVSGHHGSVHVSNAEGGGAVFTIELPANPA